jgi:tRNA-splicing ligase RtcB
MSDNVRTWTAGVPVEDEAWAQIRNLAALPILAGPIAVMPDVHLGKGAAVGNGHPTRAAIIPAAVGVDIGCGMVAVRTTLTATDLPDSLASIRAAIERAIPVGFAAHKDVPRLDDALEEGAALDRRRASIVRRFDGLAIMARLPKYEVKRVTHQLGSLGGGNHFIEICLDEADGVWAMLHSGSRNVGNTIGETAIAMARRRAEREHIHLPDRDLAWLPENTGRVRRIRRGPRVGAGLRRAQSRHHAGLRPCGAAARASLSGRGARDGGQLSSQLCAARSARRAHVLGHPQGRGVGARRRARHRAGAAWARARTSSAARATPSRTASCSHGAGRRMSRGEARRRFTRADLADQTAGVECRKDAGVIDESPQAYKDIEAVMAAQADLTGIVHTLKQVLCVKG